MQHAARSTPPGHGLAVQGHHVAAAHAQGGPHQLAAHQGRARTPVGYEQSEDQWLGQGGGQVHRVGEDEVASVYRCNMSEQRGVEWRRVWGGVAAATAPPLTLTRPALTASSASRRFRCGMHRTRRNPAPVYQGLTLVRCCRFCHRIHPQHPLIPPNTF